MATGGTSKLRWGLRLLFAGALLAPVVVPWLGIAEIPEVGSGTLVRLVGLAVVALAAAALVRRKRRSREQGQQTDPDVEGTGDEYYRYAYTSRTDAAKEGDRITEEAERLAEAERDADKRRDQRGG